MDKKKVKELLQDADICFLGYERNGCRDLVSMGLQKLHEAQEELSKSDWISVEDGLPDINQNVWVRSIANPDEVWTARRTTRLEYEGDMLDSNGFVNIGHSSITHWKPIEKLEE